MLFSVNCLFRGHTSKSKFVVGLLIEFGIALYFGWMTAFVVSLVVDCVTLLMAENQWARAISGMCLLWLFVNWKGLVFVAAMMVIIKAVYI